MRSPRDGFPTRVKAEVARSTGVSGIPGRKSSDPAPADVIVRFACTARGHISTVTPERIGGLVQYHGTFGYCPARAGGPHEWKDVRGIRLGSIRRRQRRAHLGY